MLRLLVLAACLLPAVALADVAPSSGDMPTGPGTGSATDSDGDDGEETSTMPPKYEGCGCRSQSLGVVGNLALLGLGVWALRRRAAP